MEKCTVTIEEPGSKDEGSPTQLLRQGDANIIEVDAMPLDALAKIGEHDLNQIVPLCVHVAKRGRDE
jgi:hypothetical protein